MGHALLRPLFAFLLLAGFLARSTGLERLHLCPTQAADHGTRHEGHQHDGTTPGGGRCECVGQSCTKSVGVPVARAAIASPVVAFAVATLPAHAVEPRAVAPYLLPFAHGPPA
jgi:hypothetical protein